MKYKGIILAGGSGTRLYPMTSVYSKQLIVVYDKPMIYYPLSTLMMADVREVLIIAGAETIPWYEKLLGDGSRMGMSIQYAIQEVPRGIAEAFVIGEKFIGKDGSLFILGDNIFYGYLEFLRKSMADNVGATIFGYRVRDPERYGVVEFDERGNALSLEEKPAKPRSNFAVPGLYVYNNEVAAIAKNMKPSARGELEITDLNRIYLQQKKLRVQPIGRGVAWLDSGTPQSLLDAGAFIAAIEERQGLKIGCVEEIAFRRGFVDAKQFDSLIHSIPRCQYRKYLEEVRDELQK